MPAPITSPSNDFWASSFMTMNSSDSSSPNIKSGTSGVCSPCSPAHAMRAVAGCS
jgi:hypothetical protein